MKASMALVATNTRVEEFPIEGFSADDAIESGPHGSRAQLLSASTRLAVGLGLKGVLPCAGWAGLTDSPRRKLLSAAGPPLPQSRGIGRRYHCTGVLHTSATCNCEMEVVGRCEAQLSSSDRFCSSRQSLSRTSAFLGPCNSCSNSSSATATM